MLYQRRTALEDMVVANENCLHVENCLNSQSRMSQVFGHSVENILLLESYATNVQIVSYWWEVQRSSIVVHEHDMKFLLKVVRLVILSKLVFPEYQIFWTSFFQKTFTQLLVRPIVVIVKAMLSQMVRLIELAMLFELDIEKSNGRNAERLRPHQTAVGSVSKPNARLSFAQVSMVHG